MINKPLISVLIATYNGAAYLAEQLDSIYQQTYKNIEVIVCDDNSTDWTEEILKRFQVEQGLQYYKNFSRQGVIRNFEKAIGLAKGEYIALADQDDVWLPHKLELSLQRLVQLKKEAPPEAPLLVYTDLQVVDEQLNCISPSYWQFMQINPENNQLNRVLVENVATGCTIVMNKACAQMALPIPPQALMHDVWLLLTATCFGKVAYIATPTMLYRQHRANVVGARPKNIAEKLKSAYTKLTQRKAGLLHPEIEQARAFYSRYKNRLSAKPREEKLLQTFITLKEKNFLLRKLLIRKYAFFGSTFRKALNVLMRA